MVTSFGTTPTTPSEPPSNTELRTYDLKQRFRPDAGPAVLTGVQAVARLLAEQHVRDARSGRRTASLVSGYPGSPLAGLDTTLAGATELARDHHMRLVCHVNEELAAPGV